MDSHSLHTMSHSGLLPPGLSPSQFMSNTYGALLIGTLVATFASGMNALQTVLYFRLYPEDSIRLKALVATVLGIDLVHTFLLWADLWFFFVENFGNPTKVNVIQKPLIVPGAVIVGTAVSFIVHLFYLRRVFDLSNRNYWISVPILILILAYTGSVFACIDAIYRYQFLTDFSASRDAWLLSFGFSFSAVADIAIMASLFVLLRMNRKRSISLDNVIDKLILYSLEMGSLTAILAIAITIIWFVQRNQISLIFLALYLSLSKAYTFSFLGSLNTRYQLRQSQNSQRSHGQNMTRRENIACQDQSNPSDASSTPSQILVPKRRQPSPDVGPQDIHVDMTRSVWHDM